MNPESRQKLRNMLIQDETYRQFPYTDTTGKLTVAIGRNLSDRGISFDEALTLLDKDIIYFSSKLSQLLPFFHEISEPRQIILVNLCFNLGVQGFLGFKKMIEALESKDYNKAADEIINSKAAEQLPDRYHRLAYIMRTNSL